jgi:hypothetical protein
MIKICTLTFAFLIANLVSRASTPMLIDSNSIKLKISAKTITYIGSVTSDGQSHTDLDALAFDFSKLTLEINGIPSGKPAELKIFKRKPAQPDADGPSLQVLKIPNSDKVLLKSLIDKISDEQKANGLVLSIRFDKADPLVR